MGKFAFPEIKYRPNTRFSFVFLKTSKKSWFENTDKIEFILNFLIEIKKFIGRKKCLKFIQWGESIFSFFDILIFNMSFF